MLQSSGAKRMRADASGRSSRRSSSVTSTASGAGFWESSAGGMRVAAFLTEYPVVDQIIRHLKLTFAAEESGDFVLGIFYGRTLHDFVIAKASFFQSLCS